MASGAGAVLFARALDRTGKGIRGAPRDALIADLSSTLQRGEAYGLRQSLDSLGAFIGPLIAIGLMMVTMNDFRLVFWLAMIPGVLAVLVIIFFVREPAYRKSHTNHVTFSREILNQLGRPFWVLILVVFLFSLARFSEAFILLRAADIGLDIALVPVMLMILSLVYALFALPAGKLSDRIGRTRILAVGLLMLICADVVLGLASNVYWVAVGAALWGLHMALTQGLFSALIADITPQQLRGTAFGMHGLVSGAGLLIASLLAGWVWELTGASGTFTVGAILATLCLLSFYFLKGKIVY